MHTFSMRMKTWDDATDGLVSRIPQALKDKDLILGWSAAADLIGETDWDKFKQRLAKAYPDLESNPHRLGSSAGNLWRFVHDMKEGDFVIVPDSGQFYLAKVTGPPRYDACHTDDDTAYRRKVEWQNSQQPLPRGHASSGLQSRMKAYHAIAWADEFTDEIHDLLGRGSQAAVATVGDEIAQAVRKTLLGQLRQGRMNDRLFEKFIAALMRKVGCSEVRIVPRPIDKGADIP